MDNERLDRRAVGAAASAAPAAEAPHGSSRQGSPHRPQRHPLDLAHGQSVALPCPSATARGRRSPAASTAGTQAGIWDRVLAALQRQADAEGRLDWSLHFVDSTVVRAHQHAAGAKGGTRLPRRLGRSRGGYSTKIHLRCERGGKPMVLVLTER